MKKWLLPSLLGGLLSAAAPQLAAQASDHNQTTHPSEPAPQVGLTRDAARQRYGEPFTRTPLSTGERWLYRLKFDEVYGRAMVPFLSDSNKVRLGTIDFGPDGRARAIDWPRTVSHGID